MASKRTAAVIVVAAAAACSIGGMALVGAEPATSNHDGHGEEVTLPALVTEVVEETGPPAMRSATEPITTDSTVTINGTDLVIPVPQDSSLDRMQHTQFNGHDGVRFAGTSFMVSGPGTGTFVGSIQVVAVSDAPVTSRSADIAAWVDGERESEFIEVAGTEVVYWPSIGGSDGSDINQVSRNWSQYALQTPDGKYVLEIIFDGIPMETALDYVEQVVGGLQ